MEEEFQKLLKTVKSYNEKANLTKIRRAWEFTKLAHIGQKRKSGEPFVTHPLEVAKILAGWKLDVDSILAAFLHDTVEDGGAKKEDIVKEFGTDVAGFVEGLTKISSVKLRGSKDEEFIENLRKMFLAMAKDLRIVLIKFADKYHNLQTIYALPPERQIKFAREILEVFAPLAERLGMGNLKANLDDLAFEIVYPDEFNRVKKESASHYKKAGEHVKTMKRELLEEFVKEGITAKIAGRKKHFYSLWKKMERPEIDWEFSKVYDIVALRVLVNSVSDCYSVLGIVHGLFRPVPHLGVSDFIASPKPSGYQSIHTRVFGSGERIVEVQIRTYEMHEQAEYGVAAHWAYDQMKSRISEDEILERKGAGVSQDKLGWVRQLADWQKEISDSKEFLEAVKYDALKDRIFVFSPKGDVYDLPYDATPVDFAYAVHTDLGNFIKSVKVNEKIVPLKYKLRSGDICEIIKLKNSRKSNKDWLTFVVTSTAKRGIIKQLKK